MSDFKPKEGEWFAIQKKLTVVCCHCQMVHRYEFRQGNKSAEMRAWVDKEATLRRRNRKDYRITVKIEPRKDS